MTWQTGAAIVLSYVAGSIPTGLWFGKALRGVDIREHGSRNIGATNTLRVLGKKLGAIALAGDVGKGLVAVLVIAPLLSDWPYAPLACGVAAIVGHIASVFVKFRGGKGVATSTGVFLALTPVATVIAAGVFAGVVYATRMVSAGSLSAATALLIAVYVLPHEWATYPTHALPQGWALRAVATAVAVLVFIRHRANLQRILKGEENRF
ncbi:MAG TPA: glycerol-3-phosphate 1-O-acyltransferase PlsY [Candidatus Hydrogenedentes bacterium]|nr:glycerol-3-phosphate 1-O-acyltransferase PlsY [Candidatus Hydrogenedentota bacterium]HQE84144.1 glycerol-3-phosphate 1-O-acyltransferase PlsY [Candidatus Hydrogenedentota bacterium]HQH52185.1 glycerol-3-phosphate 1-O-acyltransferase PlsY [Candidatus Hydrogenedentota bacterium]HQM47612.1 glycerol-3-phosphate 1-O-acyltransferase PlsY [Candidatus Hydrogenedentota bacterium]